MSTSIDQILNPSHDAQQQLQRIDGEIASLDRQLACLDRMIESSKAAADRPAPLDDLPLTSLQMMRNNLARRRNSPSRDPLPDDTLQQLAVLDAEILQRTCRIADRAGMPWTLPDDQRLLRLIRAGEVLENIASALGRNVPGIVQHSRLSGYEFGDGGQPHLAPVFDIQGTRLSLAELLTAQTIDDTLAAWANTARVGDRFPALVHCERVS
jgi:hypothetical protein